MLLGSPVAETTMNMHSCPTVDVGTHSNGPTIISALLFGGDVPARQLRPSSSASSRSGQTSPAPGSAWKPSTITLFAGLRAAVLDLHVGVVGDADDRAPGACVPPSACRRFQIVVRVPVVGLERVLAVAAVVDVDVDRRRRALAA